MIATAEQHIKAPSQDFDIHPLLQKRWSPLAFSEETISEEQLQELFEAARWSASANNEQPWRYVYGLRGAAGFNQIWDGLLPGNQVWANSAAALVVSLYRKNFQRNGQANPWAMHDVGMANAQLVLQATHRDIYTHMMAGFDRDKLRKILALDEQVEIMAVLALGYLGDDANLPDKYQARERSKRQRLSIHEFTHAL